MKSKEELAEEYRKQFAADGSHMERCSHMSFIAGYEAAQIYFKFMHVKSKYIQAVEDAIDFIQHNVDGVAEDQNESEVDPFMVDDIDEDGKVYFSDGRIGVYDPQKKSWSITYNFKEQ